MIIGIDLGTTNSLVAVWKDEQARLIPNALGKYLTPSVVGLDDNGDILVGQVAKERLMTHSQQTTAHFKRYMGTQKVIALGKKSFRAEELSALVLKVLKQDAEVFLGEAVTEAVITVPAYFNDAQRKATKVAGELAGLQVSRLINEPTAAALAYGVNQKRDEQTILVFDLGGGTYDVTVLEFFDGVMEVHASTGDNFLGGEDFTTLLIEESKRKLGKFMDKDVLDENKGILSVIRNQAEIAKQNFAQQKVVESKLVWQGQTYHWQLEQKRFEALSEELLYRLRTPIERALRDSRIKSSELDDIILVGGATRMQMIKRMVATMFGRMPSCHINPDEVVALGAAMQAGLKSRDSALKEVVLTDVAPYTLGIEVVKHERHLNTGFFLPVIERNTVIPASRVKDVYTVNDYQKLVMVRVYQGESHLVKENIFLGELEVNVPAKKVGEVGIDVRFTYDINGLLEVEASLHDTGDTVSVVIEDNPGVLTKDEIAQRLKSLEKLKIHPRDETENRVVLARLQRLYEQNLGELRQVLGDALSEFMGILDYQDPEMITEMREQLEEFMDKIEQDYY